MKIYSFPKKKRLVNNQDFRSAMNLGRKGTDKGLIMFAAVNGCQWSRLGVSVGKACGSAVKRNRIKRLFRESFRLIQNDIVRGFDYLFIVTPRWELLGKTEKDIKTSRVSMNDIRNIMLGVIKRTVK